MGILACYFSVDEPTTSAMWELSDAQFRKRFAEMEEDDRFKRVDIGKVWDVLHCTLTGVSASNPIEGNRLSEAIVGVFPYCYDDEDYSTFVSIIPNDELQAVITALEPINAAMLSETFDSSLIKRKKIYPTGIGDDPKDQLVEEMADAVSVMRAFYKKALEEEHHILATML